MCLTFYRNHKVCKHYSASEVIRIEQPNGQHLWEELGEDKTARILQQPMQFTEDVTQNQNTSQGDTICRLKNQLKRGEEEYETSKQVIYAFNAFAKYYLIVKKIDLE